MNGDELNAGMSSSFRGNTAQKSGEDVISIENIFQAWDEFKKGKRGKRDVQLFERNLEDNLFSIHKKLENKSYKHGNYESFYVNDPKRRHIHKASVQDRIIHLYSNFFLKKLKIKIF